MKSKISKVLVLISLFASVISSCATENRRGVQTLHARALNGASIEQHEKIIAYDQAWNKGLRLVAGGMGGAAALAACLMLYNDFTIIPGDDVRSLKAAIARLAEKVSHIQGCEQCDGGKSGDGWGWYIARVIGQSIFTSSVGYAAQKCYLSIFHENTVHWFVQEYTELANIADQLQILKADIDNLRGGKVVIAVNDCDYYVETLFGVHAMIADQLEQLIGYMNYSMHTLANTSVETLNNSEAAVCLSNRVYFVADLLNKYKAEYKLCDTNDKRIVLIGDMFQALHQLMLQINSTVKQFRLIEKKLQAAE